MPNLEELGNALYPCFIGQLRYAGIGSKWVATTLSEPVLGDPAQTSAKVLHAWVGQVIDGDALDHEAFIQRPDVAVGDTPEEAMRNLYAKGLWRQG